VRQLDALEYSMWAAHLEQYGGDYRTHQLLATLCCLIVDLFKKKGSPPTSPYDFAYWLEDLEKRLARFERWDGERKEREAAQRRARADLVGAAYERFKADREGQQNGTVAQEEPADGVSPSRAREMS